MQAKDEVRAWQQNRVETGFIEKRAGNMQFLVAVFAQESGEVNDTTLQPPISEMTSKELRSSGLDTAPVGRDH